MKANQFLQDYIKGINPISAKERTEEDVFKEMMKDRMENPAASFGSETLDLSVPEMAPGPYFPGQELMRDKYIREQPGSGISGVMSNPELVAGFNHVIGPDSSKSGQRRKLQNMIDYGTGPEKQNAAEILQRRMLQGIQLPLM
tara:strand:+ start:39 stop:467 length:429 start_codon:yes stop_codon:yes gene_type:complete